jgi:hypothetical protein
MAVRLLPFPSKMFSGIPMEEQLLAHLRRALPELLVCRCCRQDKADVVAAIRALPDRALINKLGPFTRCSIELEIFLWRKENGR